MKIKFVKKSLLDVLIVGLALIGSDFVSASTVTRYDLDSLIKLGVAKHSSIMVRSAQVDVYKSEVKAAESQYFPTPSIQTSETTTGRTTLISISQPLWNHGGLSASVAAAVARTNSAQLGVLEAKQILAFNIASSYQSFIQSRLRSEAMQRYIERLVSLKLRLVRRVDGGISADSELNLIDARLAQARVQHKAILSLENISIQQLSEFTGEDLGNENIAPIAARPLEIASFESIFERSEVNSPTLRRMWCDIDAAISDASVKRALKWPTVALVAQRNINQNSNVTNVGIQFQYTPGAGFSSAALANAADSSVLGLRAARSAARSELFSKVRSEYEELRSSLDRRLDLIISIQTANSVLASNERLFIAGKRSLLDVATTARDLSDTELLLADLEAFINCSIFRLKVYEGALDWMK